MTTFELREISQIFGIDLQIVQSWYQHKNFSSILEAKNFFEKNQEIIKAKPFVKWVGGKRQILSQLQQLFPKDFGNYHEPFLGGGAVFFSIQRKQSFLSDINSELINTYKVIKENPKDLIKIFFMK